MAGTRKISKAERLQATCTKLERDNFEKFANSLGLSNSELLMKGVRLLNKVKEEKGIESLILV